MDRSKVQQVWAFSYEAFSSSGCFQSDVQKKASRAIMGCKSGSFGINVSQCPDCGHTEFHNNSCRNRNCPNCQAVNQEIWVDKRRAEVIDAPYFHVVFTLPHELNSRLISVDNQQVSFSARGRKPGEPRRTVTLENTEFIRRYLMHVLPCGFQKIRYYGFLNNRGKSKNLKLIFTLQGHQRFQARYVHLSMAELIKAVWKIDIRVCPECGCFGMQSIGRTYGTS